MRSFICCLNCRRCSSQVGAVIETFCTRYFFGIPARPLIDAIRETTLSHRESPSPMSNSTHSPRFECVTLVKTTPASKKEAFSCSLMRSTVM